MKNKILTILFLLITTFTFAVSQGPFNPSSSGTNTSVGTIDWSNVSNVQTSDNNRSISNNLGNGDVSYYLTATNFGFSIPAGSTIDGIFVEIEKSDASGGGNVKDNIVKLIKGGTIQGNDNSAGGNWSSTDGYSSYGNGTNLWGLTLTVSDINASNFGVAVSVRKTGSGTNNARVDHIRITVHYTDGSLPIELLYFGGSFDKTKPAVDLDWATETETNNDYFLIERSKDAINFDTVAFVSGNGTVPHKTIYNIKDYNYYDNITYYRLTQVDFDGYKKTYTVIAIDTYNPKRTFKIYPNPAIGGIFTIEAPELTGEYVHILIYDINGKLIYDRDSTFNSGGKLGLFTNDGFILEQGLYTIEIMHKKTTYISKVLVQ